MMASLHKPERGCGTPLLRAGWSRSRGSPSRSRGWHSLPAPRDRALCPCTGTASCRQESAEGMQKQEPWKQQVGTLLVLFIYFPNPQAKQPQIMAGKEHMAESSARVALGATKLEQPMLAGLQPREMLAPAKSILYGVFHATTLPGSMSKHL